MQGQRTGYSGSKVKRDWNRSRSRSTSAVDGMDGEARLRFEMQILEELFEGEERQALGFGG
ncbi:uncharacterized protein ASPGLDRAFT_550510 [Aspergillus glaucus CBS 516.65]|uniref:Uncharacterized protein n=1 Tax=Aspergillus glaucus CBS 516.65 TaxID=1160497 RepID=A0A1L9VF39_ASPGL|nr:hypothetical protein ASPGLDRAFT_550510 [Aspergillus glaucus CBS 516.65]OJJ82509.1 hypothetical protein ASPGLDRAFT_550510 [Aspergillus glaucus CBS 516.65]